MSDITDTIFEITDCLKTMLPNFKEKVRVKPKIIEDKSLHHGAIIWNNIKVIYIYYKSDDIKL